MTPFRLALLNLARHRAATLLAVASLALAVACAGILLRAQAMADARFSSIARVGDALLGAKADPVDMVLGALNLEGSYPGTIPFRMSILINNYWLDGEFSVGVTPIVFCGKYRGRRVIGTSPTAPAEGDPAAGPRFLTGLAIASGAWPATGAGVVAGAEAAAREGLRVGDTVGVRAWTSDSMEAEASAAARPMRVTGILEPMGNAWDGALFTNLIQAQTLLGKLDLATWDGNPWEWVAHYLVLQVPPEGMERLQALVNQRTVAQLASVPAAIATLERLTASGRALGLAVTLLALFLAAAAVAALMLGRFESQSRQVAALEAIGYARPELLAMLAWEGALLGLAAAALGAALEAAAFPFFVAALPAALPAQPGFTLLASWPAWFLAVALVTAASVLSSLFIFVRRPGERLRELA